MIFRNEWTSKSIHNIARTGNVSRNPIHVSLLLQLVFQVACKCVNSIVYVRNQQIHPHKTPCMHTSVYDKAAADPCNTPWQRDPRSAFLRPIVTCWWRGSAEMWRKENCIKDITQRGDIKGRILLQIASKKECISGYISSCVWQFW